VATGGGFWVAIGELKPFTVARDHRSYFFWRLPHANTASVPDRRHRSHTERLKQLRLYWQVWRKHAYEKRAPDGNGTRKTIHRICARTPLRYFDTVNVAAVTR